ncbi:MAG: hypothetical protein Kow0047_06360 [Anaerolineae bacterium]
MAETSWRWSVYLAGSLTLLALVMVGALRSAQILKRWVPDRNLLLLPTEIATKIVLVVACVALGWTSGLGVARLGWHSPRPLADLSLGLAIGVGLAAVLAVLTPWADRVSEERLYDDAIVRNITPRRPGEWPGVLLALIPAVLSEELLFRSLLLGGLSPPIPVWPLALILSLCFGVVHWPQGLLAVAVTFAVGMAFSGLFVWRQTLLAPVVAHYVANVLQIAWVYRQRRRGPSRPSMNPADL